MALAGRHTGRHSGLHWLILKGAAAGNRSPQTVPAQASVGQKVPSHSSRPRAPRTATEWSPVTPGIPEMVGLLPPCPAPLQAVPASLPARSCLGLNMLRFHGQAPLAMPGVLHTVRHSCTHTCKNDSTPLLRLCSGLEQVEPAPLPLPGRHSLQGCGSSWVWAGCSRKTGRACCFVERFYSCFHLLFC